MPVSVKSASIPAAHDLHPIQGFHEARLPTQVACHQKFRYPAILRLPERTRKSNIPAERIHVLLKTTDLSHESIILYLHGNRGGIDHYLECRGS